MEFKIRGYYNLLNYISRGQKNLSEYEGAFSLGPLQEIWYIALVRVDDPYKYERH